jgi:urease accessory protein
MMLVDSRSELPTWENERLPSGFTEFPASLPQMRPGAPGKVGQLRMRFERRSGRTKLVDLYSTGPLRVNRVLYIDDLLDDMAFVFMQSVSGGILQGDRYSIEVEVGQGARVHLASQAATKVYRMEADYATQHAEVRVEESGYLEYWNDPVIPYRGVRFFNSVDIVTAPGAAVVYSEALSPGRVAFGESFEYELVRTQLTARSETGRLRAADVNVVEPGKFPPTSIGLFGPYSHVGSLLVLSPAEDAGAVVGHVQTGVTRDSTTNLTGVSALPLGDGAFVRTLGHATEDVQRVLEGAWEGARRHLIGAGLPRVRSAKYGFEFQQR